MSNVPGLARDVGRLNVLSRLAARIRC